MATRYAELVEIIGQPDCSGRYRFSKRQRPLSKRVDWCPWCRQIMKGSDPCPAEAALASIESKP